MKASNVVTLSVPDYPLTQMVSTRELLISL